MNVNKVFLMGRLTADPELKTSASGVSNVAFSIAVNRRFKDKDGKFVADFLRCTAFRQTAEFVAKYFKKGSAIIIFGSVQNNNYKDKNGNDVHTNVIVCDEVQFGESKGGEQPQGVSTDVTQFFAGMEDMKVEPIDPTQSPKPTKENQQKLSQIDEPLPF